MDPSAFASCNGVENSTRMSAREEVATARMSSTMTSSSGSRSGSHNSSSPSSSTPLTTTTTTPSTSSNSSSSNNSSPVSTPFSEGTTTDDDDDTDTNDASTPPPSSSSVDHTSTSIILSSQSQSQQVSPDLSFPWRLHMLLNEASSPSSCTDANIICGNASAAAVTAAGAATTTSILQWTDHGTAFEVLQQPNIWEGSFLLKKYFGSISTSIKYNSFRKQLANYGFVPIPTRKTKSKKFKHPDFSRDHPEHCHRIRCLQRKKKRMRTEACKCDTTTFVPDISSVPAAATAFATVADEFEPIPLREILRQEQQQARPQQHLPAMVDPAAETPSPFWSPSTALRIEMPTMTFVQWPSSSSQEEQYRLEEHQYGNPQHPHSNNPTAAGSMTRTNLGNHANSSNAPSLTTTNASTSSSMSSTTTENPSSPSTTSVYIGSSYTHYAAS